MQDNLCGNILYSTSHIDMKCSSANKNNECIHVSNNEDSCLMNDTLDSICKTIQNELCKDIYGLGNAKMDICSVMPADNGAILIMMDLLLIRGY